MRQSSILSRIQGSLHFGAGGGHHQGRPSTLFNEDDFDYAIELLPDDEYRQAAEALPEIVDFDEVELIADDSLVDYHLRPEDQRDEDDEDLELPADQEEKEDNNYVGDEVGGIQEDDIDQYAAVHGDDPNGGDIEMGQRASRLTARSRRSSAVNARTSMNRSETSPQKEYDLSITAFGTGPLPDLKRRSSHGVVSKREFSVRLNLLKSHKTWVEKAARRSSIGFQRQFPSSDKEAMDKFLVLMAQGIHVRRHQSGKVPEMVRLFSSTGCQCICWEKPKPIDLLQQRQREGVHQNGSTNAVFTAKYDRNIFDFFIASK